MQLNQYYTDSNISDKLINCLEIQYPHQAFDLGFGSGELLKSVKRRWSKIRLAGADIDPQNVSFAKKEALIDSVELDGFLENVPNIILEKYGNIDILISNPPFFQKRISDNCLKILQSADLLDCISIKNKTIPSELIFLAQNLRLLSETGEIGIILPAGLVTGERWKALRSLLFIRYNMKNIIQLPESSFSQTEAQTFMLIFSKSNNLNNNVITLSHINKTKKILIPISEAIERADYNYYEYKRHSPKVLKIETSDFKILRGNKSRAKLKIYQIIHIHSTDFSKAPSVITLASNTYEGVKVCETGDILVARVGSRCVGRIMYVSEGSLPISDCVIVIRAKNKKTRTKIWEKLCSPHFQEFLNNSLLGVGPKYITHNIVKEFLTNGTVKYATSS